MKKFIYSILLAVACITSTAFTSCSNEETVTFPIDEELAGNYKGQLKVNVDGQDMGGQSQIITVEKAGDNSINLSLTDFSFIGINIGDIELTDCPLVENAGDYTFTGTTSLNTEILKADVNATGTIGGGKVDISMDIAADLGGMKQTVKVTYTGDRLKGTESSEAKITKFIFDENVAQVNSVVVQQPVINEETKTITFMVSDTAKAEHLVSLVPTIEISEKATLTPGSGVAQDFSNSKTVKYTVEAEDGTSVVYTASVKGLGDFYFGFEDWTVDESQSVPENQYPIAEGGWASCNQAVLLIKAFGPMAKPDPITYTGGWPISSTDDAYAGSYAVQLESIDTQGSDDMFGQKVPKVTAGSIFLGNFNAFAAMSDPMATTEFGVAYDKKPLKVTGYYKYTPGTEFYNSNRELVEGKIDECSMSAVLFEINDDNEYLKGDNIYTSDKIVAKAMFRSSETVTEYTPFELNLEYVKEYDPTKKYKFTVILSASADGAAYNAAVGSKLIVDDVIIENQK